ncbi:MAG: hypothetical protein PHT31_05725 [Candidatus Omnitrophica bacterium]|nr:hypothetical protein [Candidatus Omnitrophota bacterium]MDD5653637.1 hypothetical protein [Candidatus Omnitrophota bacterium]
MPKDRLRLAFRIKHLFVYHPWLKFIALILAILVWFYVRGEISQFNY